MLQGTEYQLLHVQVKLSGTAILRESLKDTFSARKVGFSFPEADFSARKVPVPCVRPFY